MVKALDDYRSPVHKVLGFLKKGRDDLRVKYRELMEQRRVAENQVRAVEKSRAQWRARAEAAEAELSALKKVIEPAQVAVPDRELVTNAAVSGELLDGPKVPGSIFSLELVTFVLRMVIEGAVSMRAASRISGLICEFIGGHRFDGLSHATVQNYLLRIGLDQIDKAIETCSDRVWIMDHMIAAGSLKCFIVLGISADAFARLDRPLEHGDVDVLTLIPTEVSNGAVVNDQLRELAGRRGVPLAILNDCGSDLKKGVELFQQAHPATISLFDIVHLASRLVWKRLGADERFSQYRQACCQSANRLRQSSLAHLKPPRPKTKARYMNVDPEIRWGRRALWLLDRVRNGQLTDRQQQRLDRQHVESQLGWLEEYREELNVWSQLCEIGQASCTVVRTCGYSPATTAELKATLGTGQTPAAQELIADLIAAVEQQCQRCAHHPGRLPGSSEVLESLIGKGKRLLGTSQNNNSLTGQILSIAASTVKLSVQTLLESLRRCRLAHVHTWLLNNIRPGIHVARSEDLSDPERGINLAQSQIAATPAF